MDPATDVTRRLAEVNDALYALADDASAEKYDLLKNRDRLREEASQYAEQLDAQRSDADLPAGLSGLRSQLRVLESQKIDLVTQAGGASRLQARLGVIKGILQDRGVEIPKPR